MEFILPASQAQVARMMPHLPWLSCVPEAVRSPWRMIIRPPRAEYGVADLGPPRFRLGSREYERRDIQLLNPRGQKLECSHFRPIDPALDQGDTKLPCVVYLHGNCSSRLEAADTLHVLLPRNIMVFCLDLSGSGRSEGEFISLGRHEEQDLCVVVRHLRELSSVSAIALWGRSMGAAASIFRVAQDRTIAACVLDSPYSRLRAVAKELVNNGVMPLPEFMLDLVFNAVRDEVLSRAGIDISELSPIDKAPEARAPVLFGVAADDDFILPHHTLDLHAAWGGSDRRLVTFDGGHNGARPAWFLEEAAAFLDAKLAVAAKRTPAASMPVVALSDDARMSLPPPPMYPRNARAGAAKPRGAPKAKFIQAFVAQPVEADMDDCSSTCGEDSESIRCYSVPVLPAHGTGTAPTSKESCGAAGLRAAVAADASEAAATGPAMAASVGEAMESRAPPSPAAREDGPRIQKGCDEIGAGFAVNSSSAKSDFAPKSSSAKRWEDTSVTIAVQGSHAAKQQQQLQTGQQDRTHLNDAGFQAKAAAPKVPKAVELSPAVAPQQCLVAV